jgi:hypothetical protein
MPATSHDGQHRGRRKGEGRRQRVGEEEAGQRKGVVALDEGPEIGAALGQVGERQEAVPAHGVAEAEPEQDDDERQETQEGPASALFRFWRGLVGHGRTPVHRLCSNVAARDAMSNDLVRHAPCPAAGSRPAVPTTASDKEMRHCGRCHKHRSCDLTAN